MTHQAKIFKLSVDEWSTIPHYILRNVVKYTSIKDTFGMRAVCNNWRRCIDDQNFLWGLNHLYFEEIIQGSLKNKKYDLLSYSMGKTKTLDLRSMYCLFDLISFFLYFN